MSFDKPVEQRSALDPNIAGMMPQLQQLGSREIGAVGPRNIVGFNPQETQLQQQTLGNLGQANSQLVSGGMSLSPLEQQQRTTLQNLLGTAMSPMQSPLFQNMQTNLTGNAVNSLQQGMDQLNSRFALAGQQGMSSPLMNQQNILARNIGNDLNTQLGGYAMNLYGQAPSYANQLGTLGQYERMQMPVDYANAILGMYNPMSQIASQPRMMQQQVQDEAFNAQMRQRQALLEPFQNLLAIATGIKAPEQTSIVGTSDAEKWMMPLNTLFGGLNTVANLKTAFK